MKRILKGIPIAILALLAFTYLLNSIVRVSHSRTQSIGIVEQLLFGRPIKEALEPPWSENYKRWDSASKASASVADLLQKVGVEELVTKEDFAEQRTRAHQLSELAFVSASAVSKRYLADCNADLPEKYSSHFVPAMDSWRRGLSEKNPLAVRQGISNYNAFLVWVQSRDRSDFKPMR